MKNYSLFLIPVAAVTVALILILTAQAAPATKTTVAHMAVSGMTAAEVAELFE